MRRHTPIPAPRPGDAPEPPEPIGALPAVEALALHSRHADALAAFVEQMLDAEDTCYREHIEALEQQRRALDTTHHRRRRALLMLGDRLGAMNGQLDETAHLLGQTRLAPSLRTDGQPA